MFSLYISLLYNYIKYLLRQFTVYIMAMSMDNSILSSETIDENESITELNLNLGDNISTGDNNSTENKKAITEDPSNENNFSILTTDKPLYDWSKIWELIKCPVCFERVKPPVSLCINGHHLCSVCWTRVTSCSICRSQMSEFRCFVLERILLEIPSLCVKELDGCPYLCSTNDIHYYNITFKYRNYQCPIECCTSKLVFKDFLIHMLYIHGIPSRIIKKQKTEIIPLLMEKNFLGYFKYRHTIDIIFFLHYIKQNKKYYFWVTYITLLPNLSKQRYELVLTDLNIKSKGKSKNMKILKLDDASIFDYDNFFEVTEDFFDSLELPILTLTIMNDNSSWNSGKQQISLIK